MAVIKPHNFLKATKTNLYPMHVNPVLENDTHKHIWDVDIKMDHLNSARRPDL